MRSLLLIALLTAFSQLTPASAPPERFEYLQGYGLGGHHQLTWDNGKLVLVKTPLTRMTLKW
jgi:hypothetical protein